MMKIKIQERKKQGSGSEVGRKGGNYFNNIAKELSIEDTAEYKEFNLCESVMPIFNVS